MVASSRAAQERHRRDHDSPDARHGQPRGVQHHRVAGTEQDAVAGLDPHVAREHGAQSIDQVLEPAIAPVALGRADGERVRVQSRMPVEKLDGTVEERRIPELRKLEQELRPLRDRRQMVAYEGVDVRRGVHGLIF